ncbi:cupin [Mycolicibacterium neworleansense]|uniref:Mannose-6-phosphate isomerase n=1 Tax=Mycolicibacterium neworleansense TaxID=146018 RepID=A0A0H5RR14_9MYCO|nr:cupin [Mycolicibacterium neworleansense]MCV7365683.1 cupin [Mycolicibacterium neworleansense]CRZ16383.1 mannose-6-phosphate isomerase [Mycolicibacterium neworleansense]
MSFWDPRNVPPYPPIRYTKDEPEVSARLRRGDEPPDYDSGRMVYHYLANQQQTDGDYGLYRVDISPPGGIHGFRNDADAPTSLLMLFAPGAPREAFFEGFAQLADLSDEERAEWFIKNDNYFL